MGLGVEVGYFNPSSAVGGDEKEPDHYIWEHYMGPIWEFVISKYERVE